LEALNLNNLPDFLRVSTVKFRPISRATLLTEVEKNVRFRCSKYIPINIALLKKSKSTQGEEYVTKGKSNCRIN